VLLERTVLVDACFPGWQPFEELTVRMSKQLHNCHAKVKNNVSCSWELRTQHGIKTNEVNPKLPLSDQERKSNSSIAQETPHSVWRRRSQLSSSLVKLRIWRINTYNDNSTKEISTYPLTQIRVLVDVTIGSGSGSGVFPILSEVLRRNVSIHTRANFYSIFGAIIYIFQCAIIVLGSQLYRWRTFCRRVLLKSRQSILQCRAIECIAPQQFARISGDDSFFLRGNWLFCL
jgi:hypothetical protein